MKFYVSIGLMVLSLLIVLVPGIIWFFRPELTQMQLFLEYWYLLAVAAILVIVAWAFLDE